MNLHSIALKNTGTFKEVEIPIDQNGGLVVIQGRNLDSQEPDNTNGAGKSLLMGAFTTALFERSPVTDLNTKAKDKKDLLQKGSEIVLDYTGTNGKHYEFTQKPSSYRVVEDGTDLKIAKQDLAKNKLRQTTLFSEEEFYSTCYIQNTKPSTFQHSTESNRLHFITNLFDLHIFDHIRNEINKKRGQIKEATIEFDTINGQLDIAHRKVKDFSGRVVSPCALKKLKSEQKKLAKSYRKVLKKSQRLEDQLDTFYRVEKYLKKRKEIEQRLKKLKLSKADVKALIKNHLSYSEYLEEYEEYKAKSKKLHAKLSDLQSTFKGSSKKVKKELKALESERDQLRNDYYSWAKLKSEKQDVKEEIEDLTAELSDLDIDFDAISELDIDVDSCKATVKLYKQLSRHLDHGDDSCPVCGSDIDLKALKKSAAKAQAQLDKVKHLDKAKQLKSDLKALKSRYKKLKVPSFNEKAYKKLPSRIEKLEDTLEGLHQIELLETKLEGFSKPDKVDKPKTKYSQEELEDFYTLFRDKEILDAKLEGVELDVDLKSTKAKAESYSSELKTISKDLRTTESKLTEAKVVAKEFEMLTKTVKDLEEQLKGSEDLISKRKLFEFLFKQYGSTEIKLQAAQKILKILENSLNTYSSLVFVENLQFKIEPSSKGVSVFYKTAKSDWVNISRLSGAETNCFRLLFCLAMLPLIPSERRPNFIVLDEPDAACSDVVRQRLIKDFLPKLRSIVPHVFWVTPKETDSFKEAEIWTVEKKNGVSTLLK